MISCRTQIYKLVQDLHHIGIVHKDLEPRNVLRARGGGFRLIDFLESRKHVCKDRTVQHMITFALLVPDFGIVRRTVHSSSRCSPKSKVFRTADIAKLIVEAFELVA